MRLGLIAGGGSLPQYVEIAARQAGTPIMVAALQPFAAAQDFKNAQALHIGQLGKAVKSFKAADCTHICMAGYVARPDFKQVKPDLKGLRHLPSIIRAAKQGDDALLRHMLSIFEAEGFTIISPQEICAELIMPSGVIGSVKFSAHHRDDALKACKIAREIGRLDIGQAAIVARGLTLAVEAQEGTDIMLERCAALPMDIRGTASEPCGVLAKIVKPHQDRRVDLPVIGPETIKKASKAGLAGIVAEAGQALILDKAETLALADKAGIFIVGLPNDGASIINATGITDKAHK